MQYDSRIFRISMLLGILCLFAVATPLGAQPGGNSGGIGGLFGQAAGGPVVAVEAQFTAPAAGKPAELFLVATVQEGWHIYSITQPPGGPLATVISLDSSDAFQLAGKFSVSPRPEKKRERYFDNLMVESHHGRVVWHAPIRLADGVDPANLTITGRIRAQPCDANTCLPPRDSPFTATLGPGMTLPKQAPVAPILSTVPASPPTTVPTAPGSLPARTDMETELPWQPFTTVASFQQMTGFDPAQPIEGVRPDPSDDTLGTLTTMLRNVMLGFLGGIILNIMPCVLPVIGLKVLSFVEQSGHDRGRALLLNVWYSLGLMSVFVLLAALAVVAGYGWGQLFSLKGFNITLAAVVFVMGLSFLGVWELPIPGFAGGGTASKLAAKEGAAGAFFKGVLTTVLATPCSAPFLAPALTWAVAQPATLTFAVFVAVGLGMASPYLLIGAFPALIRFLPKPGPWMDTFKQVMGFVLLGTVVYIFSFLQAPWVVPTIGLLFGLWGACWWIGRTPMTADFGTRVGAWIQAVAFAGVVWVLMFPGTRDITSGRLAFSGLVGVMEKRFQRTVAAEAMALAAEHGTMLAEDMLPTVMVDFTADWCLTCKTLEAVVLNTQPVRDLVDRNGVVTLHADWTHSDPHVTRMLELLGSKQVPVLAIFPAGRPNAPIILRGGYTRQTLLDALEEAGPTRPKS